MDVPLPLAVSRRLMSFLTFHISMFFSASFCAGADMLREDGSRTAASECDVVILSVAYDVKVEYS